MATTTPTRRRRWVPPEDLRSLDRAYVQCRTYGHAWDDFLPMRKPAKFGDRLSLRCIRCQTERYDIVSWVDGSLLQREYVHPEGYAMAEKHTRSEFRATLIGLYRDEAKRAEQAEHVNVTDGAVARIGNGATGRARARAGRG